MNINYLPEDILRLIFKYYINEAVRNSIPITVCIEIESNGGDA